MSTEGIGTATAQEKRSISVDRRTQGRAPRWRTGLISASGERQAPPLRRSAEARSSSFETLPSQNARRPIAMVQSDEMRLQSKFAVVPSSASNRRGLTLAARTPVGTRIRIFTAACLRSVLVSMPSAGSFASLKWRFRWAAKEAGAEQSLRCGKVGSGSRVRISPRRRRRPYRRVDPQPDLNSTHWCIW
jgi:hypothetical protein